MTPSIINTNNRNLNIKYNERLVKDIRKDEKENTLKIIENILDDVYYDPRFDKRRTEDFNKYIELVKKTIKELGEKWKK